MNVKPGTHPYQQLRAELRLQLSVSRKWLALPGLLDRLDALRHAPSVPAAQVDTDRVRPALQRA